MYTLSKLGLTLEAEGKWPEAEPCIAKLWPSHANKREEIRYRKH